MVKRIYSFEIENFYVLRNICCCKEFIVMIKFDIGDEVIIQNFSWSMMYFYIFIKKDLCREVCGIYYFYIN